MEKKWYKSKTFGIVLIEIATLIGLYFGETMSLNAFMIILSGKAVYIINRIYGTDTKLTK